MVDDKYIGLALAVSGTFAIGTSFIITKKGLADANARAGAFGENASDSYTYLRNPIWWAGMITIANFAAYTFAPPILVTPLGALSVLVGAILASFLLDEELGHLGRVGCALCLLGSLVIVLNAPADKDIDTVDEVLHYALQPGFMLYCFTVIVFCVVMIYAVAPKYGRSNPIVYISICSLAGSVSIMAIKGFGVAVKLTFGGHNQFTHPSTYVFGLAVAGCIVVQMNYFNKALDTFSTNVVNPMYYVGFSSATIVASLILFQGFNTTGAAASLTLLVGFIVTFLGVHLLNISRKPDPAPPPTANGHHHSHSALETGLMNPRLSLQGRMSLDGWTGSDAGGAGVGPDGALHSARHGRRSEAYHSQSSTLFNAFEDGAPRDMMPLSELRESEEETDEDEDEDDSEDEGEVDERTRLRAAGADRRPPPLSRGHSASASLSRSHSNSPALPGSGRNTPRSASIQRVS
ncbi:DUF803-domain-containing protein [Coniophora puteana RWD-64-598 SS2]|uniref:DUF803-domain-containing protein n=1 Tax=Coniophora puteana (strain RWD-64-598) TaxID=741705 RepID=R7SDU9_CONPW|nr:DUF803-domain-containing protein [Coniophora puteana RWD-64-598 SS2]EIW74343.1 DUF803-domain-containing protein [Coniophora puteana RWD-64-598 SS2]